MQLYKTKRLAKFAKQEHITDASLQEAILRANLGIIDADLGGGLIKERVARQGQGRSGGYRTIIAYRSTIEHFSSSDLPKTKRRISTTTNLAIFDCSPRIYSRPIPKRSGKPSTMASYRRFLMARKKETSELSEAILEMAEDMHRLGIMGDENYRKITMRHIGLNPLPTSEPITPDEIRTLREREHISQAVFARYLNLTVGYVSQLERGTKQPKGPALTLLNVIRRKGIQVLL